MTKVKPITHSPATSQVLATILVVSSLGTLAVLLYLMPQSAILGLIALGLGIPGFLLVWRRPEVGLLGLIFLAGSFLPSNIVDLRLPIGGGLDLRDLTLIGLFGIVYLQELIHGTQKVPWWPVGSPLVLFLAISMFSAFYALTFEHVESNWVLGELRILILYSTFFITLWGIKRPEQLKVLLAGLFIIADLATTIIYLQQFLGADNPLLQGMMVTRDWRVYQQAGAVRVIPATHVLMHFMWFVSFGLLLFAGTNQRLKIFCALQLLYLGGGHLLSYTRAQWTALIIGLGLAFIILLPIYKQHLIKVIAVAFCIIPFFVGTVFAGSQTNITSNIFIMGIAERFGSLFAPTETAETGSLEWRTFENEKAIQAIKEQPLTGVGLGNRYRSITTYHGEANGWLTQGSIDTGRISRFTRYVHNSYMSIAVKMGMPGLIVLLWFCASVLFKGFQVYRDMPNSEYKGVVLGILLGFTGLLEWCYYHAHLIKAESVPSIGLMLALIGSIASIHGTVSHSIRGNPLTTKG